MLSITDHLFIDYQLPVTDCTNLHPSPVNSTHLHQNLSSRNFSVFNQPQHSNLTRQITYMENAMSPHKLSLAATLLFASALLCHAEIKTTINYNPNETATSAFKFKDLPSPSKTDAAKDAKFTIVDGDRDENGGNLEKLNDGKTPTEEDQPEENFFFNAGTPGGRLVLDLGKVTDLRQV